MKKFIAVLCVILLSMCLFVGCADDSQNAIDLEKCEIGDELPIYPNFEFDYKVNDEIIVHVNSIKLILTEKNTIKQNEINEGYYYPYTMTIKVSAKTSPSNAGKKIEFSFTNGSLGFSCSNKVDSDGTIKCENNNIVISDNWKIHLVSISVAIF